MNRGHLAQRAPLAGVLFVVVVAQAQPPIVATLNDTLTRFLEGSRNSEWRDPEQIFSAESKDLMPVGGALDDDWAVMLHLALLLSPEPDVRSTPATPKITEGVAVVSVRREVDVKVSLALVRERNNWKIDLTQSRAGEWLSGYQPAGDPLATLERLRRAGAAGAVMLSEPLWSRDTAEEMDLDEMTEEIGRALRMLWVVLGRPDMQVEARTPEVAGDRATVALRKRFTVDQKVVLVQEDGAWRVDLFRTVEESQGAGGGERSARKHLQTCMSNLKQLALGALMYAADFDETMPPAGNWVETLMPYVRNEQVFRCPSAPEGTRGYAFDVRLSKADQDAIRLPADTPLIFDSDVPDDAGQDDGTHVPEAGRHLGGIVVAFADGHVKWMTAPAARELLARAPDLSQKPMKDDTSMPANAFDAYVAAGRILKANGGTRDVYGKPGAEAERTAVVEKNQGALRMLREGFNREYRPREVEGPQMLLPELALFRDLTRLLACEADVLVSEGQPGKAAQAAIDGMQLGRDVCIGGTLIHRLVGMAIEAISLRVLQSVAPQLPAEEAHAAARRLGELDRTERPLTETMEGERTMMRIAMEQLVENPEALRDFGEEFRGRRVHLAASVDAMETYYAQTMEALREPYYRRQPVPLPQDPLAELFLPVLDRAWAKAAEAQARRRLAIVALVLQAHHDKHDEYPEGLADPTPETLTQLPADPFHDGPLFYRRDGEGYLLYSAGPDCDDDGGRPLPKAHGPEDDGDLVWEPPVG